MISSRTPTRLRAILCLVILAGFSFIHTAAAEAGRVKYDVTVGPASDPVALKAGQIVQVMSSSGTQAVIMVPLPDGSQGVYQIDVAALESASTSASSTSPPSTSDSAPNPATVVASPTAPTPSPPPPPPRRVVGDPNFPEDKATAVRVTWPSNSRLPSPYSEDYSAKAGSYSYRVYLPPGYYEHPDDKYPALFIMNGGGHPKLANFEIRVKQEGWIVIMFVEARDGPWEPVFGDLLASYQDAIGRFRIRDGAKFGTGFSGGARGTSILTQIVPGFDGEYCESAGFASDNSGYQVKGVPHDGHYAVFMSMGTRDKNFVEIARMERALSDVPFKSETFVGRHEPAPPSVVNDALDWLLEQALTGGGLPDDLRAFGIRHFDYLVRTLAAESGAKRKEKLKELVKIGENLNLLPGSPEATQLQNFETAVQNGG